MTTVESGDFDGSKLYLTPDLPSRSFSPLLRSRPAWDEEASQFRVGLDSKTANEPIGLGIYGLTRQEDPSHIFDGLGIIRLQSSPWSSRLESNRLKFSGNDSAVDTQPEDLDDFSCLSQTFLHDLEAVFLVNDLADDCEPSVEIIVEEAKSAEEGPLSVLYPRTSTPKKVFAEQEKNALSLTARRPSRPPSNICATVSGPNLRGSTSTSLAAPLVAFPRSAPLSSSPSGTAKISNSASAQGSSAFVRSTCTLKSPSQRNRVFSSPFPSRTRQSLCDNQAFGSSSGVSPSTSARNLTVSVSMGPGPSGSGGGDLSLGYRSLQSHSVRDLSVVGTISSDLKKVPVPMSRSGSSSGLKGR